MGTSLRSLGALKMGDFGIAKVLSCTLACVGASGLSFWKDIFGDIDLTRTHNMSSDHDGL